MYTVNITRTTKQIAVEQEMYVVKDTTEIEGDHGGVTEIPTVVIGDRSSDFLIVYGINDDGSLYLYVNPPYVHHLPERIYTSIQLRTVVKQAVARCIEVS